MLTPRPQDQSTCPDCDSPSRRKFLRTAVGGLAVASASGSLLGGRALADDAKPSSETLVASFYKTLTDEQKQTVVFPFDHELRSKIDNNWFIVDKAKVASFYTKDQQAMIRDIFLGLHSEEYAKKVLDQVEHDNEDDGGFGACSVALFGEPGKKFEFVFSGRHVTRRCDGNSVEGAAFGGPIFYGHQAGNAFNEKPDHPANIYWYQAVRANEVFKAMSSKQRDVALIEKPRKEEKAATVKLRGTKEGLAGIPVSEFSKDQKDLVRKVMSDVLAPFRKVDADEVMKLVDFESLHLAYYKDLDVGKDGMWDVWQLEAPNMVWYFRGYPHVHTWVHVREKA